MNNLIILDIFIFNCGCQKKEEARNERELFRACRLSKWKCNLTNPKQWVNISSILFFFLVRNIVMLNSIVMISAIDATQAND
jgi:threonine/homoserine/homoserine lactone efflux protein